MESYGIWSILPPILAIILAIRTRQVIISLLAGITSGWIIINRGNPLGGTLDTISGITDVFSNDGSTQTIIFTLLIGSLIAFIQRSGGVEGFINATGEKLGANQGKSISTIRMRIQLLAAITGLIIFVESNISALTVGTLYRPITDKLKISREKLAYLADSTSAPSSILIPLNAWGGFIMGLLLLQGFDQPFLVLIKVIPFNLYPIFAIFLVFIIILTGKDFGAMARAEKRSSEEGKVIAENAIPMVSSELTFLETKPGTRVKSFNMIIPIATMVMAMPLMLVYTGWAEVYDHTVSFFGNAVQAIGHSSGAASVLYSVIIALTVSSILYIWQGIFKGRELIELMMKGMSGMIPLAIIMVLAFAIGNLCNELGTGIYIATVTKEWLSPHLVPVIIFLVSCFIAFSTGTSWGTFAIMIAIAVPVATTLNVNVYLAIAASLGGGVFGDHCSPISDTSIISSMAAASDHIDHVRTQLPYAITVGILTALCYLILGFLI